MLPRSIVSNNRRLMFILDEDEDKIHTDSEYVNKSSSDNGSSNY